ncbi:hypothetical protein ABPG77_009945 [Micractinium sp. CCAP 211/92]
MEEISPFASAFAAAEAAPFPQSPPPCARVVGFEERSASAGLDLVKSQTCSLTERHKSVGGLNQLFRAASLQHEAEAPRPRLSITTARSLRGKSANRARRVARIEEHEPAADSRSGGDNVLRKRDPASRQPLLHIGLARAASGNIDMPSRAQTAPEGLPDSLVLAAMIGGCGHSHGQAPLGPNSTAVAAAGGLSQRPRQGASLLGPARSGSNDSTNSASAASGRPPMPVTPAFVPARSGSGSGSGAQQQRGRGLAHRSASYRELFDAQTEASMAQAQVSGLQEALRRKSDELEALQRELGRVSAERDVLRHDATATAAAGSSTCNGEPEAVASGGHGRGSRSQPSAPGAPARPAGLHLARQVPGVAGVRRSARSGRAVEPPVQPPPMAQAGAAGAQPPCSAAPSQPTLVSAFAARVMPFSSE